VISIVILGGVSIAGGVGSIAGVVLAAILFGLTTFGLSLLNVPGVVLSIFVGVLLIVVVAMPALARRFELRRRPAGWAWQKR
jgi:rhamnose transport system permease protein